MDFRISNLCFDESLINEIREYLDEGFQAILEEINDDFSEGYFVLDNLDKQYGDFILLYLNGKLNNIKLTRRYLDE